MINRPFNDTDLNMLLERVKPYSKKKVVIEIPSCQMKYFANIIMLDTNVIIQERGV